MNLTAEDKSRVEKLVENVEASTGVQVLAVVSGKSDAYPEIPWKAFSLGVALATLALTLLEAARPSRIGTSALASAIVVLGTGLMLVLATIFLRPAARVFLGDARAEAETRQFALSYFFERGLSRTRSRSAVLVLVSQFERRVAIVADKGITARVSPADLEKISADMNAILARESACDALTEGLGVLKELLRARGFTTPPEAGDEIPEEFLETEGPKS